MASRTAIAVSAGTETANATLANVTSPGPLPGAEGVGKAGKLYMVGEHQRVYVVDNYEAGSGTYFEGSWDDKDEWESAKGPRMVDLGVVSDEEKGEGLRSDGAGKDRQ